MAITSTIEFKNTLKDLIKALRTAKKNKVSLSSYSYYGNKVRTLLAKLRKSFIALQRDFPPERYGRVAYQLITIEPMLQQLISQYPGKTSELLTLADEIMFKVDSDFAAEVDDAEKGIDLTSSVPFIPNDLIEDRLFVFKKILWEINRGYDVACYNSCAAMIRRLTESLIIESFEKLGIGNSIKKDGEYFAFSVLISKAISEPKLALTRNTKKILPDLKFLGDLAAHNRRALVRKEDLDKLHHATRSAIEELVYFI